jgi:hypothetical protein
MRSRESDHYTGGVEETSATQRARACRGPEAATTEVMSYEAEGAISTRLSLRPSLETSAEGRSVGATR